MWVGSLLRERNDPRHLLTAGVVKAQHKLFSTTSAGRFTRLNLAVPAVLGSGTMFTITAYKGFPALLKQLIYSVIYAFIVNRKAQKNKASHTGRNSVAHRFAIVAIMALHSPVTTRVNL